VRAGRNERPARILDGRPVVASFVAGKPAYTWRGFTIVGPDDLGDGVERSAVLRGNRLDVREGRRITVVGVLRVIDHPARRVGGELVLPWSEVRIEQR
jgi:hypothetical protein